MSQQPDGSAAANPAPAAHAVSRCRRATGCPAAPPISFTRPHVTDRSGEPAEIADRAWKAA